MAVGAILSGAGSILGGVAQGIGAAMQYKTQTKLLKQQQEYQKELMNLQNDLSLKNQEETWRKYNSPGAQRWAARAAGVNPFVEGSGGLQSASMSAPAADAPSVPDLPNAPNVGAAIGSAIQQGSAGIFQMTQQAKVNDAQVQLMDAQRIKTLAEATGVENENSLFAFTRSAAESDALSRRFRSVLDEVNARFAEVNAVTDLSEKQAKIASIWADYKSKLASAAKTDAERLTIDTMRDLQKRAAEAGIGLTNAQTANTNAQTQTEGARKANLEAQTETENKLREGRITLTRRQADSVLQEIGLTEARTLNEYEALVRAMTNTGEVSTLWGYVDKIAARLSREDGTASYARADELRQKLIAALAKYEKGD